MVAMGALKKTKTLEVYISYSRKDASFMEALCLHLTVLQRSGLITIWSDRNINPGSIWEEEINRHIRAADIILLLVSPDFLNSESADNEIRIAMRRQASGEVRVIPIIVRPCIWSHAPFRSLQALPLNGKPALSWNNLDEALFEIVRGIRDVVNLQQKELEQQINWVDEGDHYMQQQSYRDAFDAYEEALRIAPVNVFAYIGRGNALRNLGRPTEALSSYLQALRLSPTNVAACIGRGNALSDLSSFNEALEAYDQALHLAPDDSDALFGRGYTLYCLQRYEEALISYRKLQTLYPNNIAIYMNIGNTLHALGREMEALAAYQQILSLAPKEIDAYLAASTVLVQLQKYEDALALMNRAIILDANNLQLHETRIAVLNQLNRGEEISYALAEAEKSGFHIDFVPVSPLLSESVAEDEPQTQTSVASIQQFLEKAGFEVSLLTEGFLVAPRHQSWKPWFSRSKVFVRMVFDRPLDPRTVRSIAGTARRYESKHALVIINQQPELAGWNEINILRGEEEGRRCICLTIDEALIQNSLAQHTELSDLLTYVQQSLGGGFDPYHEKNPVSGIISFFGRQRIIETLLDDLQVGHHSGIFGLHKMGKSSLMYELRRKAEFPIAYVYLHDSDDLSSVYRQILTSWEVNGHIKYSDFAWTPPFTNRYEHVTHGLFAEAAKSLLDYLHDQSKLLPRAGIFLDEIGHFVPSAGDHEKMERYVLLMDALRGLHQETQSVPLLVAGVHPGVARYNYFWGSRKNPLHQIITEHFLTPMEAEDCQNMILFLGKQIGLEYNNDALAYILKLSGAHPYIARHLCSLVNSKHRATRTISVEMVEEAASEFIRNPAMNTYFNETGLWNELRDEEIWKTEVGKANQELLLMLAASSNDLSEDELCTGGLVEYAFQEAFYALKERSIITSPNNDGYYHITFEIFRRWIRLRQLHMRQD
jgi:tetratricopeptide (TPR) repeat protein